MPIATASGTASGPAPAPSHVPTVPTGNHAIIRLSIAKATASQRTRNQPVEVAVVKNRCALAASVQKRHRTTEPGTAKDGSDAVLAEPQDDFTGGEAVTPGFDLQKEGAVIALIRSAAVASSQPARTNIMVPKPPNIPMPTALNIFADAKPIPSTPEAMKN